MRAHATVEELSSYLDGELEAPRLRLVESHLENCTECRERLSGMRRVVSRLAAVERSQPPPHLGQQLSREVALRRQREPLAERLEGSLRRLLVQPALAPAFAVVLALAAILYLFSLGIARRQEGSTRIVVQPVAESARSQERAAGRLFDRVDGTWIERGVEGLPVEVLTLTADPPPAGLGEAEVEALLELGGPVRLRLLERVVELTPAGTG